MPPLKRKCASCRYFQSNQLAGNGWCTHPARQTSSDVRILVRKDELACRNAWGSDLWVSATGEHPAPTPQDTDTTQLPIALQRRDDEVTSVVHRDAPGRPDLAPVVERDDKVVVEASLVPELRDRDEDDTGNASAHADQEHRARILARGGNHSAIQDARERMLARRAPHIPLNDDEALTPDDTADSEPQASDASPTTGTPVSEVDGDDSASFDSASTPVEAPLRARAPHGLRDRGHDRTRASIDSDIPASTADADEDVFNSIPEIDPSIELPLMRGQDGSEAGQNPVSDTSTAPSSDQGDAQVTVYDAVLERARAIRAAAGKDTLAPVTPDHVRAEEIAREEKRARRRITTVPPAQPVPSPAIAAVTTDAAAPDQGNLMPEAESAGPRPRTFAELRRQQDERPQAPAPRAPRSEPPRMGIAIGAIRQEPPSRSDDIQAGPRQAADDVPIARHVDFRRLPVEPIADPEVEPLPDEPVMATVQPDAMDTPEIHDEDTVQSVDEWEEDDLLHEELHTRRGPFGRFRNPWRKDRDAIRDHQLMATVREALAETDAPFDDPFADVYADDLTPEPVRTRRRPTDEPAPPIATATDIDDAIVQTAPALPTPAHASDSAMMTPPPASRSATPSLRQPSSVSRAHGLYRPVHEDRLRKQEQDRVPSLPSRQDRGNGATVLRVRADSHDDEPWDSPEVEPFAADPIHTIREPRRSTTHRDDGFPPFDADPARDPHPPYRDEPEPELQPVEPAPPVAESPWSFAPPVDLESDGGMAAFRGRLFGGTSAPPRRHASQHRPGDDVVLDVPPRAESTPDIARQPLPPKDSPLRSANYRSSDENRDRVARPEPPRTVDYVEHRDTRHPGAGDRIDADAVAPAFDIRNILTGRAEPLDLGVSIAPDIPRACRTCRDFRPSEHGERGFCANNWAFTHRQMVNADDLPCQSTIGCWWLPSDRIWMPEEREETAASRVDDLLPSLRRRHSG
ncbi:MAG: hypothetical protein QM589_03750 [Thermomicrobiales bacterium]